ncbi:hypothetical protein G7046_g5679 [Stylonectria norvegica]|nr:hypothetical protein G7046_g5679 [Stylonectria norvegica]
MADFLEQFIVFGHDSAGIERTLRLFQSICHILISYPLLLSLLPITSPKTAVATTLPLTLVALRSQFNLSRRLIRLFRFLGPLRAGAVLFLADDRSSDVWLEVISKTCFGIYGFIESATMLDVLEIQGLQVVGAERSRELNYQAQFFWFIALYSSVLASGVKLFRLFAVAPAPKKAAGSGTGEKTAQPSVSEKATSTASVAVSEKGLSQEDELKKEQERLRGVVSQRKAERRVWLREVITKAKDLGKKMITESVDMILPIASIGWIKVHPGVVGVAMFCTTIVTGLDVWHRCGSEVQKKKSV